MARKDTPGTGEERDPAGADRVNSLERRARWLLHAYPAAYRRERAEEIIATLLETTPPGRSWPRPRDVRALVVGGLKARAALNRHRTASTNLRVAVMVGISFWLAVQVGNFLVGVVSGFVPNSIHATGWTGWTGWPAALSALLTAATVVLAWTASRFGALAGALAASAAVVSFALPNRSLIGPNVTWVLCLTALVALAPRPGHASLHWLWPSGLIAVASPLIELCVGYGWLGDSYERVMPSGLLFGIAVAGTVWIGIDARPIVAVLTFFAVTSVQETVSAIQYGSAVLGSLPFVLAVATIAAPTIWLLRRQSAPARRTA